MSFDHRTTWTKMKNIAQLLKHIKNSNTNSLVLYIGYSWKYSTILEKMFIFYLLLPIIEVEGWMKMNSLLLREKNLNSFTVKDQRTQQLSMSFAKQRRKSSCCSCLNSRVRWLIECIVWRLSQFKLMLSNPLITPIYSW